MAAIGYVLLVLVIVLAAVAVLGRSGYTIDDLFEDLW